MSYLFVFIWEAVFPSITHVYAFSLLIFYISEYIVFMVERSATILEMFPVHFTNDSFGDHMDNLSTTFMLLFEK